MFLAPPTTLKGIFYLGFLQLLVLSEFMFLSETTTLASKFSVRLSQPKRLNCVQLDLASLSKVGLDTKVLMTMYVPSALDCVALCSVHIECESFGFEPENRICHLHISSSAGNLTKTTTLIYGNRTGLKALTGSCAHMTCAPGEICHFNRATGQPFCTELASSEDGPTACSSPPDIEHAAASPGDLHPGSVRNYSCHHGYHHLSNHTSSSTCLSNGSWSIITFKCSGPFIQMTTMATQNEEYFDIPAEKLDLIVANTEALVFYVKTCHDANFGFYFGLIYQRVVIGGFDNTKSDIRTGVLPVASYESQGIVSCDKFLPFWISWKNNKLSVGTGTLIGKNVFMKTYFVRVSKLSKLQISSYINNAASWLFVCQKGCS